MAINNFDVLKKMAADNLDIRLGVDVVELKKVKAGTEVTVGIGGDVVGSVYTGDLSVCLILFNKKQFDETRRALTDAALKEQPNGTV